MIMSNNFAEVSVEDFSKITMDRLPHQEIETALITMGGGGVRGTEFKTDMLKRAGWTGNALTSFAKRPEVAAEAFNRVRLAIAETEDPDKLRSILD